MTRFLRNYAFSIITIAIIIYLSFFTPPENSIPNLPNLDKLVHLCMYGGLTTLLWIQHFWCHKGIVWSHLIIGGVLCPIIMSGLIEIGQSYLTETRSGEWLDFAANSLGVFLAANVSYFVLRRWGNAIKNK